MAYALIVVIPSVAREPQFQPSTADSSRLKPLGMTKNKRGRSRAELKSRFLPAVGMTRFACSYSGFCLIAFAISGSFLNTAEHLSHSLLSIAG